MRGANENIRAEKIGDEMFWLFGQELYNYGSPQKKKKKLWESLPGEFRKHICPFSISVSCHWFSFWTVFYFLPPTIHSSLRNKNNNSTSDINHMGGMYLLCRKGNFMRAITDQLQATNMIRLNKRCIGLWFRAQIILMNKSISNGVAKRKLINCKFSSQEKKTTIQFVLTFGFCHFDI